MYEDDFDQMPGRVVEHKWRPCRFKNATFCMVCGKLISSLGECPEEIPSDRRGFKRNYYHLDNQVLILFKFYSTKRPGSEQNRTQMPNLLDEHTR